MANRKQGQIALSIVIPAYNEAKRLPETLTQVKKFLKEFRINYEVIVVDDGSTDGTSYAVRQLDNSVNIIQHNINHGKGEAVKTGVLQARGRYLLMMDADNSIPIGELKKLWPHRNQYDIIIGSRFLGVRRFWTQNWSRLVVSKLGNLLFRLLFALAIRDTQCGFKLFSLKAAKSIFRKSNVKGFGFDMEILVLAQSLGYKTKETSVDWHDSPGSSVRASQAAFKTALEVIGFWLRIK